MKKSLLTAFILSLSVQAAQASVLSFEEGLKKIEQTSLFQKEIHEKRKLSKLSKKEWIGEFAPKIDLVGALEKTKGDKENESEYALYTKLHGSLYEGGKSLKEKKRNSLLYQSSELDLDSKKRNLIARYTQSFQSLMAQKEWEKAYASSRKRLQTIKRIVDKGNRSGLVNKRLGIDLKLKEESLSYFLLEIRAKKEKAKSSMREIFKGEDYLFKGKLSHYHLTKRPSDLSTLNSKKLVFLEKSATLDEQIERSKKLPKLDYEVSYGRLDDLERLEKGDNELKGELSLTIPLFNYQTNNSVSKAYRKALIAKLKSEQGLISERESISTLFNEIESLQEQIHIVERKVSLLELKFKTAIKELRYGQVDFDDLVESETELFELEVQRPELALSITSKVLELESRLGVELEKDIHQF